MVWELFDMRVFGEDSSNLDSTKKPVIAHFPVQYSMLHDHGCRQRQLLKNESHFLHLSSTNNTKDSIRSRFLLRIIVNVVGTWMGIIYAPTFTPTHAPTTSTSTHPPTALLLTTILHTHTHTHTHTNAHVGMLLC